MFRLLWVARICALLWMSSAANAGFIMLPTSSGGGGGGPTAIQTVISALQASPNTSVTVTLSAVGAGHTIVCGIIWLTDATALSSVTDGTNTYTRVLDQGSGSGFARTTVAYSVSVSGSPTVITANWGSAVSDSQIGCTEIATVTALDGTGAAQIQVNPGTSTDAVTSGTFTAATGSDYLWGFSTNTNSPAALTGAGTGFTQLAQDSNTANWGFTLEGKVSGSGSVAATFTTPASSSQHWYTSALAFH